MVTKSSETFTTIYILIMLSIRELNLPNIDTLLQIEQCKLIYRILNQHQKSNSYILLSNEVHNYNTRILNDIYRISTRTNIGLYNPIVQASTEYNKLPVNIKNST